MDLITEFHSKSHNRVVAAPNSAKLVIEFPRVVALNAEAEKPFATKCELLNFPQERIGDTEYLAAINAIRLHPSNENNSTESPIRFSSL